LRYSHDHGIELRHGRPLFAATTAPKKTKDEAIERKYARDHADEVDEEEED